MGLPPFTQAVAHGMRAYALVAFRWDVVGRRGRTLAPGTVIVATHRRETDVPLVIASAWGCADRWRHTEGRAVFAARADLHERGFFAGFPVGLPVWGRRLLWPLAIGRQLVDWVRVFPLRSGEEMELAWLVRHAPELPVDDVPGGRLFRDRAALLGLPAPRRAGELDRPEHADLLWRRVGPADLPGAPELWARWRAEALRDFRRLVDAVRAGGILFFFPEGRPSPDGTIGPILPGVEALVRRAKPPALLPVCVAYDPLVRGRTRAVVAVGEAADPGEGVLALLRRGMPLTAGQVVADRLVDGAEPTPADLAEAREHAVAEGRPVAPFLSFAEAREAAREAAPATLAFLAREYRSARDPGG